MNPQLLRLAAQLEKQGKRLEAQAVRAVTSAYGSLSLSDLVALVNSASQPLYAAGRVQNLDMLMNTFRQAAASLARPEQKVVSLLGNAVQLGSSTGAEMLAVAAVNPELIDAFRVRPAQQIEFTQHAAERLARYWGVEQARLGQEVQGVLLEGLERGQGSRQMAAFLRDRVDVSKSRSLLIVANELGNASAAANQTVQESVGATEFIWLAANDSRTRPSHAARNGKTYRWDDPPGGEIPGRPIRCRCVAAAVVPKRFQL